MLTLESIKLLGSTLLVTDGMREMNEHIGLKMFFSDWT